MTRGYTGRRAPRSGGTLRIRLGRKGRGRGMDRAEGGAVGGGFCLRCAAETGPPPGPEPGEAGALCPRCGGRVAFGANGRAARGRAETWSALQRSAPLGGLGLAWRNWLLRMIERLYWSGTFLGALAMLACGGIVPVMRAWLHNEIDEWSGVVATLGGLWFRGETLDPDSDPGPVLAPVDAPQLFAMLDAVARQL